MKLLVMLDAEFRPIQSVINPVDKMTLDIKFISYTKVTSNIGWVCPFQQILTLLTLH
jgi:hypothetical protein